VKIIKAQKTSQKTPKKDKTKKYLAAAVICTVVFVLFLVLWYTVPVLGSDSSEYCARCHVMAPEYLTWQNSYHSQFACKDCHRDYGMSTFFKYQGKLFKEIFSSRSGSGDAVTSAMQEKMPDSVCLGCHSENRQYSPSSDTVIPHSKHRQAGVKCVTCHAGVAHGRIVERGVTKEIPPEEWHKGTGREQMDFKYTTPRMAVCLDCHGKRRVSEKCSVCHSRQIVPANHKSGDFERSHGIEARKDFKPCNLCHVYSLKEPVELREISVSEYIKGNTFCFNCHLKPPSTHKKGNFGEYHSELARTRGTENCMGCHDVDKPKPRQDSGPINSVYCNKCHWFE